MDEGRNSIGILVIGVCLLLVATTSQGVYYQEHREEVGCDRYSASGGGGYADADYEGSSTASAGAAIEYPQQNAYGGGYAYYDWVVYITDYDPQLEPPLTAHVSVDAHCMVGVTGYLQQSSYLGKAAASGYAGGYSASTGIESTSPDDGDFDSDYFSQEIDMSYNGATVYLGDLAFAQAEAYSTQTEVGVSAEAQASSSCSIIEEN